MKKLIVSGDSCTDLDFESVCHPTWDFSWPKWPEHVAKHLGMELVCLGKGGQGNQYIYSTLQDEIIKTPKEEIGLVIAAWSQSHREDYQEGWFGRWRANRVHKSSDLLNCVKKSMRQFMSFQILCERFNLPYCHFMMGALYESMFKGLEPTELDKLINPKLTKDDKIDYKPLRSRELDEIEIKRQIAKYKYKMKNFLTDNIPKEKLNFTKFTMLDVMHEYYKNGDIDEYIVSPLDYHPNEKGHKVIADNVIERFSTYKVI